MSPRHLGAQAPRRAAENLPETDASTPTTMPTKAHSHRVRNAIVWASVSTVGILGVAALGSTGSGLPALPAAIAADQAPSGRDAALSRSDERGELSVEDLAAQRSELIEAHSEKIEEGTEAASFQARKAALTTAAAEVKAEADRLANLTKFLWPTAGGVSSEWGMRLHPILHYYRMHDGTDIGGKCGQPIYAAQSGTVIKAATGGYNGGSGNNIRINHGDINGTSVQTGYLHMQELNVTVGQKVTKGDLLGTVGNTGLSTACHLHFSMYENGKGSDPMKYIGWDRPNHHD